MKRGGCVYILTNKWNTTLYVGVTSNIQKRIYQHKTRFYKGSFSDKYNLTKLVYYEGFNRIEKALEREKQLKNGSRKKKIRLIEHQNPDWVDLYSKIKGE